MMSATVQTSRTTHPSSYSGRFSNAVRLGSPRGRFAWKRQSLHERPTPPVVSSTSVVRLAAQATSTESGSQLDVKEPNTRPLKVLIAGGGIGGLAAALSCRKQGMGKGKHSFCIPTTLNGSLTLLLNLHAHPSFGSTQGESGAVKH